MRIVNLVLAGCVVVVAFANYELKYDERALDERVTELRRSIRSERDAVAVLRAEWSLLNRPARIERLARKHLGMKHLTAKQILTAKQYEDLRQPSPAEVAARLLGKAVPVKSRPRAVLN